MNSANRAASFAWKTSTKARTRAPGPACVVSFIAALRCRCCRRGGGWWQTPAAEGERPAQYRDIGSSPAAPFSQADGAAPGEANPAAWNTTLPPQEWTFWGRYKIWPWLAGAA